MPTDSKPELEKELSDIRREVIESRNLVIKTDNLLKNLHAELKAIGKRQEDFEKRQWLSSAVAYVLFVALAVAGSGLIVTARGTAAKEERERLEKQVSELSALADKQKTEGHAASVAAHQAAEVYQKMTTLQGDERLRGVDELVKLDQSRLSALEKLALADRATALRKEIGQAALEHGRAASRRNDAQQVISELSRFMAMNPSPEEATEVSFLLGVAYAQVHKHDQAIPLLTRFLANEKRPKLRDYAMLLLATSYEESGQLEKAAATAREAIGNYPNSDYLPQLKARLSAAKRMMAPPDGGVGPAPAPKASAPTGQAPEAARPSLKPAAAPLPAQ